MEENVWGKTTIVIRWMKNNIWKLILAGIIIFIIIPVAVYALSTIRLFPMGGNNDWAGFWGGYLGALVGAGTTLIAVLLEIRYNREQQRESDEKGVRPYLYFELDDWHYSSHKRNISVTGKLHNIGLHAVCDISFYENNQHATPNEIWRSKGTILTNRYIEFEQENALQLNLDIAESYFFTFYDVEGRLYKQEVNIDYEFFQGHIIPRRFISLKPVKIERIPPKE